MISNKRRTTDFANRRAKRKQAKIDQRAEKEKEEEEEEENGGEIDEEEHELESFLFGRITDGALDNDDAASGFLDGMNDGDEDEDEEKEGESGLLSFEISTKPNGGGPDVVDFHVDTKGSSYQADSGPIELGPPSKKKPAPAWCDPDDEEVSVDIVNKRNLRKLREDPEEVNVSGTKFQERLKTNFEKVLPAPAWADLDRAPEGSDDSDDEEERIFKSGKKMLMKPDHLPQGLLNIKRLKDINKQQPSNATITSLKFHPTAKIALTASLNKHLNIFQIDGKDNNKLKSVFLTNFPIWCADFTPSGDKIVCSARRKHFYMYDMLAGSVVKIPKIRGREEQSLAKFVISPDGELIAFIGDGGYVHLVSMKTMNLIGSLKMNANAYTASFSSDSSRIYTTGHDGEIYVWDVKSRRCMHRFHDDGSLCTTSIGISKNSNYVALGSSSGVVNVYDDSCITAAYPTPLKTMMNLTTRVGSTAFNPTSEILASYSSQIRNGMKLLHFPSLTVFSNWPIEKQTLGNISCVDFSPNSGYMGVGNEQGRALLFRLNHFPDS